MKVVFLNVWGESMLDELLPYLTEQARDTEIFCFQEANEGMKQRCQNILAGYEQLSHYKRGAGADDFPQATFIRKSIEIVSSGTLMSETADTGLAQYAKIKMDGRVMYICNMHGVSRPGEKLDTPGRLTQSRELIEFFDNMADPVIIGGDFNILPNTRSIEAFREHGYRDLIAEFEIDTTRNHLAWDRYPTKLFHSDYVFLKNNIQLKGFTVPKNVVSDHLPLIVEFEV